MTKPSGITELLAFNFNLDRSGLRDAGDGRSFYLTGQSFMHDLAREGDVLSAEVFMAAGGTIDAPDEEGRRPLHEAAFFGHTEMVRFLLDEGAAVDTPVYPFGHTALYLAVQRGWLETARYLIARGASLGARDKLNGQGLLHVAAARGDMQMAGILIAAGADIFDEDIRGRTPRDHAARGGHAEVQAALMKVMEHHARYARTA